MRPSRRRSGRTATKTLVRMDRGTIVLGGAMAQRPAVAGHAWVFLQYLLGFRQLGYDVLFVDRLPGDARYLARIMETSSVPYSLLDDNGAAAAGLDRATVVDRVRRSTLLLNVMGYIDDAGLLAA